ncbi:hypothetical protein QJQ45_013861 [Haematococcus lacustris]|nr:hypothetical protein QJQ45_013861 [Haematococcus lacustris]
MAALYPWRLTLLLRHRHQQNVTYSYAQAAADPETLQRFVTLVYLLMHGRPLVEYEQSRELLQALNVTETGSHWSRRSAVGMLAGINQALEDELVHTVKTSEFISLSMDESTGVDGKGYMCIFMHSMDRDFPIITTKEARALASLAADQPAASTASWSAQGSKQAGSSIARSTHSSTAQPKRVVSFQPAAAQGRQEVELVTGPAPGPAVLDVSHPPPQEPSSSGAVSSVTAQWHAAQQQLHSSTQAGSGAGGEGAERPSASLLSQGQPLCLPGLLPPLVARPLGKRELHHATLQDHVYVGPRSSGAAAGRSSRFPPRAACDTAMPLTMICTCPSCRDSTLPVGSGVDSELQGFLQNKTSELLNNCFPSAGAIKIRASDAVDSTTAPAYDAFIIPGSLVGDLASAGAMVDLQPFITSDAKQVVAWGDLPAYDNLFGSRYNQQVIGVPILESPFLMYVNWPLLTSMYNISRPVLGEFGKLDFYPDTWQELIAVMQQVNATASEPVTGKPRHALCMPQGTDIVYLHQAIMASIMQTGGVTQGWLFDPLTLEPLTNNTASEKVLHIMWELSPFLRTFDTAVAIDMSQCAVALAGASIFKSCNPVGSHPQLMGQLGISPLPASTEVLDRSTMQLVPCTPQLCNSQRASVLTGSWANLSPSRYQNIILLSMSTLVPQELRSAVYDLIAFLSAPTGPVSGRGLLVQWIQLCCDWCCCTGRLVYQVGEPWDQPGITLWSSNGYNYTDVRAYDKALTTILTLPGTAMEWRVADSQYPLYFIYDALNSLLVNEVAHTKVPYGCPVVQVPRSAGSPTDFAAAMDAMTTSLRVVRDNLGAAAFREQLWGTTGFVPPAQPPQPAPPSPPPAAATELVWMQPNCVKAVALSWCCAGSPGLTTPVLVTVIAVPVAVCSLLVLLLAVIITHLRRNAKLQRSLMGHVLPPAAGDKATLVITDVQGSSKLWETMPAGVMEVSMKLHDELVRRLALDSSGYEWATEGDSPSTAPCVCVCGVQDALLRCSQWPVELAAEGSPGQPLCLAPVWPGSCVTGTSGSYTNASDQPLSRLMLTSASATQSASQLPSSTKPNQQLLMGSEAVQGPCSAMNPVFASETVEHVGSMTSLQMRQPPKVSTYLVGMLEAMARAGASLHTTVLQGLLGLMAHHAARQMATTAPWQSERGDRTQASDWQRLKSEPDLQVSMSQPSSKEAPAQPLGQVRVGWQRLCELYQEVEAAMPAALTVLAGLRVRVGLHTGLAADEVLVQRRMGASSITYGGAALVLAKAVQVGLCCSQPPYPSAHAHLPVEELRAAGISVVHMGQHLVALGEGKGATALELYCACLNTPDHAHRLWALGPLRTLRQVQPGVLHAPYGTAAIAFMSVVGLSHLKAWNAELAQECVALYQAAAQRLLLHVSGPQLPAGYWVSSAEEEGMVLAAFPCSLQCLHWALLTLTTCMDMDWPQALLDSLFGEEMTACLDTSGSKAGGTQAPATGDDEGQQQRAAAQGTVRLLRGLRLKAGVDVGEVACDLTPANGRFNYRGRCLNRAARINSLAASGQPTITTKEARALASLAADQPAASTASWSAQGSKQVGSSIARSTHSSTAQPKRVVSFQPAAAQGRQEVKLVTGPAPGPAVLDVSHPPPQEPPSSGAVSSVTAQWHAAQQQLHSSTQAGRGPGGEGAERPSASLLSQGQPLCLPGLLPPLVARPLGKRELRGIPGQVALLQVALAPHTSRAQLEAADRLGLSAPGLQLSRPQQPPAILLNLRIQLYSHRLPPTLGSYVGELSRTPFVGIKVNVRAHDLSAVAPPSPPRSSPLPDDPETLDVWILAGQSNMVGENAFDGTDYSRMGPDIAFGNGILAANLSYRVGFVPAAIGSTSLKLSWSPGVDRYNAMVNGTWAAMRAAGPAARLRGMLWVQGESDAYYPQDIVAAANYAANLRNFLAAVRKEFASLHPRLPVVVARQAVVNRDTLFPWIRIVRDQQDEVLSDPTQQPLPAVDMEVSPRPLQLYSHDPSGGLTQPRCPSLGPPFEPGQ